MDSSNYKYWLINFYIIIVVCGSCSQEMKKYDYKSLVKQGDEIMNNSTLKDIKVYAQVSQTNYERILDINSFDEEYLNIVNIFENDNVKIYKLINESESGDSSCIIDSYYDKKGDLKVVINYSSYFNSICEEGIITKKSIYHYANEKIVFKKTSYFKNNKEEIADTLKCINDYNCEFFPTFKYDYLRINSKE